jgi:hypothetical protein
LWVVVVVFIDRGGSEAGGELFDSLAGVVTVQDVLGGMRVHWLGRLDLRDGERSALGDVETESSGVATRLTAGGRVVRAR